MLTADRSSFSFLLLQCPHCGIIHTWCTKYGDVEVDGDGTCCPLILVLHAWRTCFIPKRFWGIRWILSHMFWQNVEAILENARLLEVPLQGRLPLFRLLCERHLAKEIEQMQKLLKHIYIYIEYMQQYWKLDFALCFNLSEYCTWRKVRETNLLACKTSNPLDCVQIPLQWLATVRTCEVAATPLQIRPVRASFRTVGHSKAFSNVCDVGRIRDCPTSRRLLYPSVSWYVNLTQAGKKLSKIWWYRSIWHRV